MADQVNITIDTERETVPTLRVSGRLDAAGAQRLQALASEFKAKGEKYLVIDLSQVVFVASSGLAAFLLLSEEFKDQDGKVIYVAPPPPVMHVIEMLNIDEYLEFAESLEAADAVVGSS